MTKQSMDQRRNHSGSLESIFNWMIICEMQLNPCLVENYDLEFIYKKGRKTKNQLLSVFLKDIKVGESKWNPMNVSE